MPKRFARKVFSRFKRKPRVITIKSEEQKLYEKTQRAYRTAKIIAVGAPIVATSAIGAGLGAGAGALVAPKGHKKKSAKTGALWGPVAGPWGGIISGARARGRYSRKKRR